MRERRFGPMDLYAGSRFLAPLSEEALLEAGREAGLSEGATLLELGTGNGCAAIFLAEAFHVYARGVEGDPDLLDLALANAARSPALKRLRFSPPGVQGPVDVAVSLRVPWIGGPPVVRPGGRWIVGCYGAPEGMGFPISPVPEDVLWRREATPLEWERFLSPLEGALRAYRAALRPGATAAPLAEQALRQVEAFRAHAAAVRYELAVVQG